MTQPSLFPNDMGATWSECGYYRYELWRRFAPGATICFVMLNPSTADDTANDPTVEQCQRRAAHMGYGRLLVVNIFAYRATKPSDLKTAAGPIGGIRNNTAIIRNAGAADCVVCAWGRHGSFMNRGADVTRLLCDMRLTLHCLDVTKGGEPVHPLMVAYEKQPFVWRNG